MVAMCHQIVDLIDGMRTILVQEIIVLIQECLFNFFYIENDLIQA